MKVHLCAVLRWIVMMGILTGIITHAQYLIFAAPAFSSQEKNTFVPLFAPVASVSLNVPTNVMVGENFTFTATFANTSGTASDVGYGPFIDIVFPVIGIDGSGAATDDGIDFVNATYLGQAVTAVQNTFGAAGSGGCTGGLGSVTHPYAVAPVTGAALIVCGAPGNKLVTLQLPFGSFVPGQPPVTVSITASLSNLADVSTALNIQARGGYQYGATPTNDWCCSPFDATILSHPSTNSTTWPASPVTPRLFTITKAYNGPEDETATGLNFPRQYTVTVNIANAQTLTNLDVTDTLPNNMQFVAFVSSTPASSAISTPSTVTPGGTLTRRFASVTGGPGAADATVTFSFYIPRLNSAGIEILNSTTGAPGTSANNAQATANWTPVDPRDVATPVAGVCGSPCHSITDRSIATQKSVALVTDTSPAGFSPGDTLQYTLNFQVSDFFAFDNVILTDILSDGQHLDLTFAPTLTVNGNGYTLADAAINAANYSEVGHWTGGPAVPPVDGTTEVIFRVSNEIITRGQPNSRLIGGCINPTNGSNPPDCSTYNDGATSGTIIFRARIQQNFTDVFPSGDPSVDHGDVLNNNLTIGGNVLNPTTSAFTPTGSTATDISAASVTIAFGGLTKGVYAINGVVCSPCTTQINSNGINPDDRVTYRLTYTQPASDFEPTVLTDYLPLPVFDATEVTTFSNTICGVPAAANACLGPSDTFHTLTTPVPPAPGLSTDGTANTVSFSYAAYDNTLDVTSTIDLLFTVTVSGESFADGLFLTNQVHVTEGTTNSTPTAQDAIIQIKLNEPALYTTKAAVSTNNPNGTFNPAISAPIVFNAPSTVGLTWSGGPISSNYLGATPIDSDLTQVDAGDLIRFAIVIQNTGHSQKGAFDISIRDVFQPGYVIPGGPGLNLQVYRGDGLALTYTDLGGGIFGTGIKIDDPGAPGVGACQAHDATNGRNVIVITYDLQLDNAITLDQGIINTATLFNYGAISGGPDFTDPLDIIDTATVQPVTAPLKSIVTTSESHTSEAGTGTTASPRLAAVGEIVRFRIQQGLPEGIVTNLRLHDVLPNGLVFLNDNTARMVFVSDGGGGMTSNTLGSGLDATGDETTVSGIVPTFALPDTAISINDSTDTANYAADNADIYASGTDIFFKFGTVNNTDRDDNSEFGVLEFNAIIANIAGNVAGTNRDNSATARFGSSTTDSDSSSAIRVRVVEPSITFGKTIVSLPSPLDAGGVVQYRVSLANGIGANVSTAFDVRLTDPLPAQLGLNLVSITVTFAGGSAGVTNSSTGNNLDVTIGTIPAGGSVIVDYTATIQNTVSPAEIITNTSTSTWTSMPGTGTTPNGTGSTAGVAGGTTGERIGTGASPNIYISTSSQNFTIASPAITKQLTTASASHTSGSNVTIGEEITYDIFLTFPEGTTPDDTVVDDLPTGLAVISGTAQIITTVAASGGSLLSDFNGTIGTQNITVVSGDGGSVTFAFTNIIPAGDNDITNNTILLRFGARVTDVVTNIGFPVATILSNSATNQVGTPTSSNTVDVTVVEPQPVITKSFANITNPASGASGVVNDVIRMTLTYQNTGTSNAYDVGITDALDSTRFTNITPVTTPTGFTFSTSGTNPVTVQYAANTGVAVVPSASIVFELDFTLTANNTPGDSIPNTANVTQTTTLDSSTSDGDDANERNTITSGSGTLNFNGVDLSITKDDGNITVQPGDVIIYTLSIANTGNIDATNVIVTDTVPANTTFNSASSSVGWSCANNDPAGTVCTYSYGTLATGASDSLLFAVNVVNPVPVGLVEVENTASIDSDQPEPVTINNTASDVTPLTAEPVLDVTKDNGVEIVAPGYIVNYTIIVSNTGNQDASNLQLVDTIPAGTIFVSATGGGTFASGQITWPTFNLVGGTSASFTVILQIADSATLQIGNITSFANTVDVQDDGANTGGIPLQGQATDTDRLANSNVKILTSTNQVGSSDPNVLIGEILDYSIRFDMPPGTINNLQAVDVLDHGLAFVGCNAITPISAGSLILQNNPCTDPLALTVQAEPVTDLDPNSENAGRHITFDFGQVQNTSASIQTLVVNYHVIALNIQDNINGVSGLNNTVVWTWEGGSVSGSASGVNIVEPSLAITKTVDPQSTLLGNIVTYSIQISHASVSSAPAYDVVVGDSIPAGLILDEASVQVNGSPGLPHPTITTSPTQFTVYWSAFPLGDSATITFMAVFAGPSPVINTAYVQWSSIQIDPASPLQPQSVYNIYSTERRYDPIDQTVNSYQASSSAVLTQARLPNTGFAPNVVTDISHMSQEAYLSTGGVTLNIPSLAINIPIVGVPLKDGGWNTSWLGSQAGWLEGSAFPSWNGNSLLTSHVYLSNGLPGPFIYLGKLKFGDKIIVHAYGQKFTFEVRTNTIVQPIDSSVFKHEDRPWLTLVTCKEYDQKTNQYLKRVVVRAVLVTVKDE